MIRFSCRLARPRFVLDADFTCPDGCVALFGASGSGKTTVAKLIAGLEHPDRGRIVVDDQVLVDTAAGIRRPVHQRRVGLVFQDGQLLPHLSVQQNLAYGGYFAPKEAQAIPFDTVVELLGIGHLLAARPATLSGGERQRVAIGRALLAAPRLLVMDEPLASLDGVRKLEILPFIERLRDELSLPIVYVSHALEEVVRLATMVVKMADGKIVTHGPPSAVLASSPIETPGARFEIMSILSGTIRRKLSEYGVTTIAHPAGNILVAAQFGQIGDCAHLLVKATDVTLATKRPTGMSIRTVLKGHIKRIQANGGPFVMATLDLRGGQELLASITRLSVAELNLIEGREVFALIKAASIDERSMNSRA